MESQITVETERFYSEQIALPVGLLTCSATLWRHLPAGAFYGWQPFWF